MSFSSAENTLYGDVKILTTFCSQCTENPPFRFLWDTRYRYPLVLWEWMSRAWYTWYRFTWYDLIIMLIYVWCDREMQGGGGYFHMHSGYVPRERPPFSALNFRSGAYHFHKLQQQKNPLRSIIILPFFCRSGDHHSQNFFTDSPPTAGLLLQQRAALRG